MFNNGFNNFNQNKISSIQNSFSNSYSGNKLNTISNQISNNSSREFKSLDGKKWASYEAMRVQNQRLYQEMNPNNKRN